ncbi:MAG: hypothetical protein IJW53_01680 [Clostridia bacterium]|nr:hypothetical protein [Clostridia bacterium]
MKKIEKKVKHRLHKLVMAVLVAASAVLMTGMTCAAQETTENTVNTEVDGIISDFFDTVPDGVPELDGISDVSEAVSIKRIISGVIDTLKGNAGELSRLLLCLLGITLISTLASLWEGELTSFASRAVGAVSSVMLFDGLLLVMKGASESLGQINSFFGAVIPITVAVNSVGVTPTMASTQAMGMGLTLSVFSFITGEVMTSFVLAIFVSSAASAIDPLFGRISRGLRGFFITALGIISALVGATFSLQSAISAAADSAIVRGAKYAISSSVPIVGGAVSGALGVAIGGVSYARGIVGGGAIAVILSLILSPLILLFAYRICLKAGVALAGMWARSGCEGILSSFVGSLDALIAVYSLSSVVYIAELVSFMKGGGGIA